MVKEQWLKSQNFRIVFTFIIVLGIIGLAKNGYRFGQWLYAAMH